MRTHGRSCTIALALAAGALTIACGKTQAPPSDVVARIGDRSITLSEVDAKWRAMNPEEELHAQEAMYQGRRAALDAIIGDDIIGRAARKRGVSVEQLLSQEIRKRAKAVTPTDIESFYNANKEQAHGHSLDEVRPAIVEMLERRNRDDARVSLLADLRKDAGGATISLEPPRQRVEISSKDPMRGPAAAPVTIVEFSDYQCPFCARLAPTLAKIRAAYGDRVRIVWKDYPLEEIHPRAFQLAEEARCAGDEGKFWEFHDRVFSNQDAAVAASPEDFAKGLGIQGSKFAACVKSKQHDNAIVDGQDAGRTLGVDSTPTMFINGRRVAGAQPYEVVAAVIDDELARGH
jgi:protein-disulfide isomerase